MNLVQTTDKARTTATGYLLSIGTWNKSANEFMLKNLKVCEFLKK